MLSGKKLTAVIPVRAGSKGIPGKNLRKIGKYSLLERAIKLAESEPRIDQILVSTDDPEMYELAQSYSVATPDPRPDHLATDEARTFDVIQDLLESGALQKGVLLLLQATSPLRTSADLKRLLDEYDSKGDGAFVSLCENKGEPPEKLQIISEGQVASFMGSEQGRPRQNMSETYEINGAFYLIDTELLQRAKTFIPEGTYPFLMPRERSANLDVMEDWDVLQAMLETGRCHFEEYE